MPIARLVLTVALLLALMSTEALARPVSSIAPATECWIESLSPSVAAGTEAKYVVHLGGGNGSYSIRLSYGDGTSESRSVTADSASFSHWFGVPGTYTQTASVASAGSSTTCSSQTTVY